MAAAAATVSKDAGRPKAGRPPPRQEGGTPGWSVDEGGSRLYWPPSAAARSSARAPPSIASIE